MKQPLELDSSIGAIEIKITARARDEDAVRVELSVKADPADAAKANDAFVELLRQRGIDTEGDAQTKTRAALRYFTTGVGIA